MDATSEAARTVRPETSLTTIVVRAECSLFDRKIISCAGFGYTISPDGTVYSSAMPTPGATFQPISRSIPMQIGPGQWLESPAPLKGVISSVALLGGYR